MDLEKLERMTELAQKNLEPHFKWDILGKFPSRKIEIANLMMTATTVLTDHTFYFIAAIAGINDFLVRDAQEIVRYLQVIIELEKQSKKKISEMKIFESAEEKMKQASVSFREEDYSSTFNSLNTALELVLKDKCRIPTTITEINTSNVIDLLVKHKVESYSYFAEARKRVTEIANRVKHQGYVPSKTEAILGIKAMEELISKLRDKEIKLNDEIRNKIYQGL